ncbi:M56 family metallopeptidase [Flavobacterium sp. SUN052]|uniref:M56 family metallopeptidase n=1 Tax=Flavobacterium sp. SUN052 TaxID=3002441 RepID=UPI00237D4204|nr:M56 family metallopeptidase [Flavobacterium sp. SUN052]MEC4005618.1 M56 family metallopeptidase [Flavobacterium sp. SUN052]
MQEVLIYLLKASGLMIAFFLAYHLLLRKETFFTSNRWFLLSGLFTSALLPLYFIKRIVFVERPKLSIDDLMALSNNASEVIPDVPVVVPSIDWMQIAAIGYGIVVLFLFLKLVFNLFSIFKLVRNKAVLKNDGFSIININQDITPFSFFNYIVFNSTLYSNQELESILLHEKVHSKQKHSFDVVVAQLFTIVFWINPFVWLYKKAIVQNLEFIADSKAIQNIEDKKCYQMALLKVVSHQNCLPITNHFYQSLIKKRIVMLNKNQSNKRNSWKYAAVVPAVVAFVFLFQVQVVAQEREVNTTENKKFVKDFKKGYESESKKVNDSTNALLVTTITNKNSTDEEMASDSKELKKIGIDYKFSDVKRNSNGEITAIKIEFNDNNGHKGVSKISNDQPINPIYFNFDKQNGKAGFTNEPQEISEFNNENEISKKYIKEITINKTNSLKNFPSAPIAPTPPIAPVINIEIASFPDMPKAPKAPNGSPLNNKKEWNKFEKKMAEFEIKMKEIQPEIDAYAEKMANVDEQMKPFEKEMEAFEKKMELFEKEMDEYQEKMNEFQKKQDSEK